MRLPCKQRPTIPIDPKSGSLTTQSYTGPSSVLIPGGISSQMINVWYPYLLTKLGAGNFILHYYKHNDWATAEKDIMAIAPKPRQPVPNQCFDTIILIGWSWGAAAVFQVASDLNNAPAPKVLIDLAITIDPIANPNGFRGPFEKLPNVTNWLNFYQSIDQTVFEGVVLQGSAMSLPSTGVGKTGRPIPGKIPTGQHVSGGGANTAHQDIVSLVTTHRISAPQINKALGGIGNTRGDWKVK